MSGELSCHMPFSTPLITVRHCLAPVLWHYSETLCILQYVPTDTTNHEILISSPCPTL
jgi:hypothetical protein